MLSVFTIVCIVGCIASWVAMSELLQDVQKAYPKPIFISWVIRCGYVLSALLVLPHWCDIRQRLGRIPGRVRVKACGLMLALAWFSFFGGVAYYRSLDGTTVPTNTALFQLNCVCVFAICVCFLGERPTPPKVCAVLVCFGGTALVVWTGQTSGANKGEDTPEGVAYTLIATLIYAVYECSYELRIRLFYCWNSS